MRRLLVVALLAGCTSPPAEDAHEHALIEVQDEDCTTDCAGPAPEEGPPAPSAEEYAKLFHDWTERPMREASLPLETLLYHGPSTRHALHAADLSPERRQYLESELARNRGAIEVRLVDESGAVRAHLDADGLTLGTGTHLHLHDSGSLGDIELSGRVRRVGLHHLWSRW